VPKFRRKDTSMSIQLHPGSQRLANSNILLVNFCIIDGILWRPLGSQSRNLKYKGRKIIHVNYLYPKLGIDS